MEKKLSINNKNDFKKFASTITKKEFIEDYLVDKTGRGEFGIYDKKELIVSCPKYIELENSDICMNCKECWINAIKNIYFKDDIEDSKLVKSYDNDNIVKNEVKTNDEINTYNNIKVEKDYNREYSLQEVFEFPNNTEFINGEFKLRVNDINILETTEIETNEWYQCTICREWMKGLYKLIPMEKEVMFEELLEYEGKCRIKHKLLNKSFQSEYHNFDYILNCIASGYTNNQIKEIIKTSKWFIGAFLL
jgi:hypothetical protein